MKNRIDWQRIIIPRAKELILSYSYRPTLRQIFYRLVALLLIPDTKPTYKSFSRVLTRARERGIIAPLALADRKRESSQGDYGWGDPQGFVEDRKETFARSWQLYTRPLWISQQTLPIIWLEKDSLFPAVCQIADPYRVKVFESIGYSSCTQIYEAVPELQSANVIILHLGDYDPSGEDIARSEKKRLKEYGAGEFEFKQLALTEKQILDHRLPVMMANKSDPRYKAFAEKHGDKAVELDALPPDVLENLISQEIKSHIDWEIWNKETDKIEEQKVEARKAIEELAKRWED